MRMKEIEIGTIMLSDNVFVSDPSYDTDTWCTLNLKGVMSGNYYCKVKKANCGSWGNRVKELIVIHESIKDAKKSIRWEYVDSICVDSGQMGIYDYEHFSQIDADYERKEEWYDKVCGITLTDAYGIVDAQSVVSSSGYGDGRYPIYINKTDDLITAIKVVFI